MNCTRYYKAELLAACLLAIAPAELSAQDRPTSETASEQVLVAPKRSSQSTAEDAPKKKLPPTEDKKFFNGVDLTGWDGSGKYWKVEDGAIVGNNKEKLTKNLFIWSSIPVEDFHLVVDVKIEPWNRYEILAVDDCIWATVNGTLSISVKDPKGERSGHIAFQVHAGEEQTARYKIIKLIHNPKVQLAGYNEEQLHKTLREPEN